MKTFSEIFFLLLAAFLTALPAFAGVKTVKGEFTYYGDKTESREDCRRHALEGARISALAKEFGTVVSQDTYQSDLLDARGESTYFSSLSSTAVKGEWIADEGEPEFDYSLDNDGCYIVRCRVVGKAREISNESTDFNASVLRNGTDLKNADTRFRSGDDMYLYLRVPVDGYVAAFLVDEKNSVFSLLPYQNHNGSDVKVRRNRDYVFFDSARADASHGTVDELQLTTDAPAERNRLYVVFSPNPFSRAVDNFVGDNIPRMLPYDDFASWLSRCRSNDPKMGVKIMNIDISSK